MGFGIESVNQVTSDTLYDRGACLIKGSSGKFFLFFHSWDGSAYNIRTSSSDDGIVWSSPIALTYATSYGCLSPSAIQDKNGKYWLAYHKDNSGIWIANSDNGVTWNAPTQITFYDHAESSWCRNPSLIQDNNGKYWISYDSSIHSPEILVRSSDDGINWNAPVQVTTGLYPESRSSLIQDSAGTYWLVWARSGGTIWASNSNDGNTWNTPWQIVTGTASYAPSIIQNFAGQYVLAWRDSNAAGNVWIAVSEDLVNLQTPQQIITDSTLSNHLMQTPDGKYRVSFSKKVTEYDDVLIMTLVLGATPPVACFSTGTPVALVFADVMFDASASYDPDGTIVLYEWDWDGDGTYEETNTVPTGMGAQYTLPGTYNVGLRVTDNDGLTDTTNLLVTILSQEDFNKIPETPFGTIMIVASMGLALFGYITIKKQRKKKTN